MGQQWGYHLILDVRGCELARATDPEYIKFFVQELVRRIEMIPYGDIIVAHFAEGTDLAGWTVVQLIQTSSIMGHFVDLTGDLYLDVFSCKEFDKDLVVSLVEEYFYPNNVKETYMTRQA